MCQAYDQLQAMKDNSCIRPLADLVESHCGVINQWHIIVICLQTFKKGKPIDWIVSFKTVNMHPKQRVKFSGWLINTSSVLQTTDAAFKTELECATNLYTMPAFWKSWTPDLRQEVFMQSIKLLPGVFLTSTCLVANSI